MRKLATPLLVAAAVVIAACGISVDTPVVNLHIDCAMTGALRPGYNWKATYVAGPAGRQGTYNKHGTVREYIHSFTWTTPAPVSELTFTFESIKPYPKKSDGYMKCTMLCLLCGKDPNVPNPEAGHKGPSRDKLELHAKVIKNGDSNQVGP